MNAQQIEDALYRGASLQQAGQLQAAVKLYLEVLAVDPRNPVANHNLGVVAMQTGRGLNVALPLFQNAWLADPAHQQHWLSLVRALVQSGAADAARQVHAEGVKRGLQGPDVELLLARVAGRPLATAPTTNRSSAPVDMDPVAAQQARAALEDALRAGDHAQVQQSARALLSRHPQLPWAWQILSQSLRDSGQAHEALGALEHAVRLQPDDMQLQIQLGQLRAELNLHHEAETVFRHVLAQHAEHAAARLGLLHCLLRRAQYPEAAQLCEHMLQSEPQSARLHGLNGDIHMGLQREEAALQCYRRAWTLHPGEVETYRKLGALLHARADLQGSEQLIREMLQAAPHDVQAYADLGRLLLHAGRLEAAAQAFEASLQRTPENLEVRGSWLFCLNFLASGSADRRLSEARHYGALASGKAQPYTNWICKKTPKRLRVGLVSGDLRQHPVAYFLESVLQQVNSQRIEWYVYSTHSELDATSLRLKQHVSQWQSLVGLSTADAAALVQRDAVHILIDLAGHTALNALPMFAWRPAPVQVSWLGYFATTGLAEMDYLLADPVGVPAEHQQHFSEQIWYLPETRLCFTAPDTAAAVAAPPCLQRGIVTFGSFQNPVKINDQVLRLWARVLDACPDSRLRIQHGELRGPAEHDAWQHRLAQFGIAPQRIELHGAQSREHYFASHAEVDILLDSFPFCGGTTTCEALWMGVPTVSLCGDSMIHRQGASLLSAAGLPDWIAQDADHYVSLAADKAADRKALATLRGGLRPQLLASPLMDAARFARKLEQALEQMWKQRRRH